MLNRGKVHCVQILRCFRILLIFTLSVSDYIYAEDLKEILLEVDSYRAPGANFTFDIDVLTSNGRTLSMKVSIQNRVKSLVQYVSPRKYKGRALLFIEENMWVYVPGTRRPLRISSNQQILGGVSSADVARAIFSLDYQAVSIKSVEDVEDIDAKGVFRQLQLDSRTNKAPYAHVTLIIGENSEPYKAEFYSLSKRKLKTVYFSQFINTLGRLRPLKLSVVDHFDDDSVTEMNYSNIKIAETPSRWYQPKFLPKLK